MESVEGKDQKTDNQLHEIKINDDLQKAVFDLIGDLASYHPGEKVVLFEGGGDSEFDVTMTCKLFTEFRNSTNPISCGNKSQVKNLHEKIEEIAEKSKLPFKFFSIVDLDTDSSRSTHTQQLKWDVYHIENYLLEEKFILESLQELDILDKKNWDTEKVLRELLVSAEESIEELIEQDLQKWANRTFMKKVKISTSQKDDLTGGLHSSIVKSKDAILSTVQNELADAKIKKEEASIRKMYLGTLKSDQWKKVLKGRTILKRFVGKHGLGINYDSFRMLIITKMFLHNFKPQGMKSVIDSILKAK